MYGLSLGVGFEGQGGCARAGDGGGAGGGGGAAQHVRPGRDRGGAARARAAQQGPFSQGLGFLFGAGRRNMYDPDEIEEEQRERELRNKVRFFRV